MTLRYVLSRPAVPCYACNRVKFIQYAIGCDEQKARDIAKAEGR